MTVNFLKFFVSFNNVWGEALKSRNLQQCDGKRAELLLECIEKKEQEKRCVTLEAHHRPLREARGVVHANSSPLQRQLLRRT